MLDKTYTLNNNEEIPAIGLGTWGIDKERTVKTINDAVSVGYRLIDNSPTYGNEKEVGIGINECELPREDIFLTTKVPAEMKSYESACESIEKSLNVLNMDYIDLMLIHSPQPWDKFRTDNHYYSENVEVYHALEDAYKEGMVKSIGLSNFLIEDMGNIIDNCDIIPQANQILCHIGSPSFKLIEYCNKFNITVEAYSPIAHGVILENSNVKKIAEKYNVSIAELCIQYTVELGCIPLPKTDNIKHMKINIDVDFSIDKEDMNYLKSLVINDYKEANSNHIFGDENLPESYR